jgi:hypothetical protein
VKTTPKVMGNILDEIFTQVVELKKMVSVLETKLDNKPKRKPLKTFCEEEDITRPTAYAWADKGIITFEKVGGRVYVVSSSIQSKKNDRL